jgi:Flp pilus assembly protein TadD
MPWEVSTFKKKQWYHSPLTWVAAALLVSLALLALPRAQRLWQRWSEKRRLARAEAAFGSGEYRRAILHARAALAFDPHSIEATRIIAKSLEAQGAPEALRLRQRLEAIGGGGAENNLSLAADAWKAGDASATERALKEIPAAAQENARYHELTARLAAQRRDFATAAAHWQEALRLDPARDEYALELSAAQLQSREAAARSAGLARLEQLSTQPATRLAALRLLLGESAARGEKTRALELSATLAAESEASFEDRLKHLTILQGQRSSDFAAEFSRLQASALEKPEDTYHLLEWMNQHQLALAVPDWAAKFSPELRAVPQVSAALADADARASNWSRLRDRLEGESWQDFECLRLAYLSRALERLGDPNAAAAAWSNAVVATQERPIALEILGKTVLSWGWERKADEVLWKFASLDRCPRWAADRLWATALKDRDSARLYKASRLLLRADPKDLTARNNYIALSLLTGQESDSPRELAAALYQQESANPIIATTYGLSLFQQGRAAEAAALMEKFTAEQLHEPIVALYYGLFLAGAGRGSEAAEYLRSAATAPMLPEEKALLAQAQSPGAPTTVVATLDRTRTDTLQLLKESRQAMLADSSNLTARINYVTLALLTGRNEDSARPLAQTLYKEQPKNPAVAAAYGLSLHRQGRSAEAVTLMETLSPEQLRTPVVAAYYGLFLGASGQLEKAAESLKLAAGATLLPEERAFLEPPKPQPEAAPAR